MDGSHGNGQAEETDRVQSTALAKGRVERAIQYVRHSFFAASPFTTLEDFNRKALAWRDEVAHTRPWPGDDRITVAEALEQERPSLLPLPVHPFETARLVPAARSKTICVRFDLNDDSIPPGAVGKPLTLAVTSSTVRILNGAEEIARHPRSWDRHALVEIAAHKDSLLREKRKALGSTPSARLLACVPKAEAFLVAAVSRGASPGVETRRLLALLRDYGAEPLAWAVEEAFARGTPRAASVHFLLETRRRSRRIRTVPALDLRSRPELVSDGWPRMACGGPGPECDGLPRTRSTAVHLLLFAAVPSRLHALCGTS